jgi:hypothetical protein
MKLPSREEKHSPFQVCNEIFQLCEIDIYVRLKLYNDQSNAQVFNLFIYLLLPYMFQAFF